MTSTEYRNAIKSGKPAEARVRGVLRGGYVVGTDFYTMAGLHPLCVPLSQVQDLAVHRAEAD